MPDLWLPGATRLESSRRVTMRGTGERLVTQHTMEAPYSTWSALKSAQYLIDQASEAHFTFHPITGDIVQILPADVGARTLVYNTLTKTPTNSHGTIHMQIEVVAYADRPWTLDLTEAGRVGWEHLMNFWRSWGVPDVWVTNRRPPVFPGPGVTRTMPLDGLSGHSYHAEWKDNTHGDPGAIGDLWNIMTTNPIIPKPDRALALRLQTALLGLGYPLPVWGADGSFGNESMAALTTYRADFGLTYTGYPDLSQTEELENNMAKIDDVLTRLDALRGDLPAVATALSAQMTEAERTAIERDASLHNTVTYHADRLAALMDRPHTVNITTTPTP